MSYESTAQELVELFASEVERTDGSVGLELNVDEVVEDIRRVANNYSLPADETARTLIGQYIAKSENTEGIPGIETSVEDLRAVFNNNGSAEAVEAFDPQRVSSLDTDNAWVDVVVEVTDLFDDTHNSIHQKGVVADESGTTLVTFWAKSKQESDIPDLEQGETYRIESAKVDEYQGSYNLQINKASEVTPTDAELDIDAEGQSGTFTLTRPIIEVRNGSGLIKRCQEVTGNDNEGEPQTCGRPLNNDRCADHGIVEGEFDLRIKAVMDDGQEGASVIFGTEATESLVGFGIEEAKQRAHDALDTSVVADDIRAEVLGEFVTVEVTDYDERYVVDEVLGVDQEQDLESVGELAGRLTSAFAETKTVEAGAEAGGEAEAEAA